MKGNKDIKAFSNVNNTLNVISGAYTLPLIDKLFSGGQSVNDMDDIYFALAALVDTSRITEAFHMIRGLFGVAGMEYPYLIEAMEPQKEVQESFVAEFIYDFYDVIDERRLVEEAGK